MKVSLNQELSLKKPLSKIYTILVDMRKDEMICQLKWEKDLDKQLAKQEWDRSCSYIQELSSNIEIREAYYKIRNHWYLTPSRLSKIYPESDPICWRCHQDVGYLAHTWGPCPNIKVFWEQIHDDIVYLFHLPLQFQPED